MSVTVAHRPHVHLPWGTIALVALAALAAAIVLVLVNQPWESTTETTSLSAPAAGAAAVPKPESRAEIAAFRDWREAYPPREAPYGPRNPVRDAILGVPQPGPVEAPAPTPNTHQLNFVP